MISNKVFILFLSIFVTWAVASAPADEFILDRIYTADDSPGKFMDMTGFKIKRANRSTFLVGGDVVLLAPMDDDMTVRIFGQSRTNEIYSKTHKTQVKVSIIAVDQGGDKYLFTREREKICSFIFKDCLHCKNTIETANFEPQPNSCPMEKVS